MQLTLKAQIVILAAALTLGVLIGTQLKHPAPAEVVTKTETKQEKDVHEHKTTTITKSKGGDVVTRIDDVKDTSSTTDIQHQSLVKTRSVNISALIGSSIHDPLIPIYGVIITKPVLSNLTVGGYALTNGTLGVSVGWDF